MCDLRYQTEQVLLTYIMLQQFAQSNWQANQREDQIKTAGFSIGLAESQPSALITQSYKHNRQHSWQNRYSLQPVTPWMLFGQNVSFLCDTKQLFYDYFPGCLINGAGLYFVVIVAVALSGNVLSQYLMEASKVLTLCLLLGILTFITSRHSTPGRSRENGKWWKTAWRDQ